MKCPICGKDVELRKKRVGVDELGEPVFNQYAICRDCKKQWNLDKQRAKKAAAKNAAQEKPDAAPVKKEAAPAKSDAAPAKSDAAPVKKEAAPVKRETAQTKEKDVPVKKARPDGVSSKVRASSSEPADQKSATSKAADATEEQRYSNIPSQKVRAKRERAVKQGYEEMLSADPKYAAQKAKKAALAKEKSEPEEIDEYDDMEEPMPRFRVVRVILGILSIFAFAYFACCGLMAGLDYIAAGNSGIGGIPYIVLALCMLIAGLLLLILQKKNTVFAFILPMILYLGSAVYAFLMRDGDSMLLYGAVAGAVLAVIFLILAIASRGQDEEDYDDYYDDPFEDDYK